MTLSLISVLVVLCLCSTSVVTTVALTISNPNCLPETLLLTCAASYSNLKCTRPLLLSSTSPFFKEPSRVLTTFSTQLKTKFEIQNTNKIYESITVDLDSFIFCAFKSTSTFYMTYLQNPRILLSNFFVSDYHGDTLYLQGNIFFDKHFFSSLSGLKVFLVRSNNITAVDYSVSGLSTLQDVTIESSISSSTYNTPLFDFLPGLVSLKLLSNSIIYLKRGIFRRLENLRYLYLYRNAIIEMDQGVFSNLHSLEHLFLDQNQLKTVDNFMFSDLKNLQKLSLKYNRISTISSNAFYGLDSLTFLDISDNSIKTLGDTLFMHTPLLTTISLTGNPFLQFHYNYTFCPLKKLKLLQTDQLLSCDYFASLDLSLVSVGHGSRRTFGCNVSQHVGRCNTWSPVMAAVAAPKHKEPSVVVVSQSKTSGDEVAADEVKVKSYLLIIFGVVCFLHAVATVMTIYLCRRYSCKPTKQRRQPRPSPSLDSAPEANGILNPLDSSSPKVLKSFQSSNSILSGTSNKNGNVYIRDPTNNFILNDDESYT